jgi:hypothetical protein
MSGEREREAGALALTARRLLDDAASFHARVSRAADGCAAPDARSRLDVAAGMVLGARRSLAEALAYLESCAPTVPAVEADTDTTFTEIG